MNRSIKTALFWLVVVAVALLLWQAVRSSPDDRRPEISYSRFLSDVEAGNVATVTIGGAEIHGLYRDSKGSFRLIGPSNPSLYLDQLRYKGVEIRFRLVDSGSLPLTLLGTWAPLILLGALWFYMIRQIKTMVAKRREDTAARNEAKSASVGPASE